MKKFLPLIMVSLFANVIADDDTNQQQPMPQSNQCMVENPKCRYAMVELFGECLFLQPNGSSIYYAAEAIPFDDAIAIPAVSPNWNIFEINPSYVPAFNVGAKVLFTDMDTNLAANWERVHSSDSKSVTVPDSRDMIGPLFDIGPNSSNYKKVHGMASFHFDTVNLVFAQQCCLFKRLYPNFYAGATFARIKQSLSSSYYNDSNSTARNISSYSKFTGAGPKVGMDFDYRIVAGFFFTGSSSLGLIIGESQNGTTYTSWDHSLTVEGNPNPNVQTTSVPNRTQLVPSLEERLGFSYAGVFDCWKITLGVGYQAQIYIDAVQSVDMTAPQVLPSISPTPTVTEGVYAVGFERTLSNFILTGPYISLSVVF